MENDHTRDDITSPPALAALARLAFAESRRLADDPNIVAVGCGVKLRGRAPAGTLCLQYFVTRKLSAGAELEARSTWPVSAEVEGVPSDVVEVGDVARAVSDLSPPAGARGSRVGDPLIGGYATAGLGEPPAGPGGFGTLASVCFDSTSFVPLALSAAHVWGTTPGTEAIQPVLPATLFSTNVQPVTSPTGLVRSDILPALRAAVAFANAGAWANMVTGLDTDPVVFGQGSTAVPADARTDTETVSIVAASAPAQAPAGGNLTASVAWAYQRLATVAELDAAVTNNQTNNKVLRVQKASTDAASYTGTKTVQLTAEIAAAADPTTEVLANFFVVANIYPKVAGDRVVRRLLRPAAGQPLPAAGRGFIFSGAVSTAELGTGTFAVSVFVQDVPSGITESANVAAGTNSVAGPVADCTFTVT
jgi:hypothetical protein